MSTNATGGNQSCLHDESTVIEVVTDLQETVTDLQETVARQSDAIQRLEAELKEERETRAEADARDRQRLHEVETRVDSVEGSLPDANPTPDDGETTIQSGVLTPIERLSADGDVSEVTSSASVERAVTIFQNITDWGQKAPKGYTLKPSDNPLSLLEAERDEQLAWRQWYRAAEALESLSKGAVTFFDSDRHGKMLVLHEQSEVYDRVTSGTLTPSSARAEA